MDKMTMRLLNLYCEKKWNGQTGMLDLSGLGKAEDLAELNCNFNSSFFCEKLAQTIARGEIWAKSLNSLNLSANGIYTLRHLTQALTHHDVRIQNLCLSDNRIKDLSEIDELLDLKLREVLLAGNPVAGLGDKYHRYVVKKLRSIELLDSVSVQDWRKELLPTLPEPRDSSLTEENANLVFQMCRLYFSAVDQGNFDALIDAYDKKCIFTHVSEPSQRIYKHPASKAYHSNLQFRSHNLKKEYSVKNPSKYCFSGRPAIIGFLQKELYCRVQTKHDVSTFKADATTMGDTIIATVHGLYTYVVEGDKTEYQRCFDRVFVFRPNTIGTEWPARIANDSVTIRSPQDHAILVASSMPQATPPMPTPMAMPAAMPMMPAPPMQAMPMAPMMPMMSMPGMPGMPDVKMQLMQQTGMNETFASLLLKETDNSLERAMALFKQNQMLGLIPAEAFQR
eukprot:GGOE01003704.1.p1 GENE.GGOE01003704.1~~GGOE01003704.1.p1  ORF type:complete len:527 (-),score=90.59 GGOE01003704.1:1227-2579(-)